MLFPLVETDDYFEALARASVLFGVVGWAVAASLLALVLSWPERMLNRLDAACPR